MQPKENNSKYKVSHGLGKMVFSPAKEESIRAKCLPEIGLSTTQSTKE